MKLKIDKKKLKKPHKQFKASYGYKEPVFKPKKVPWINEVLIKGRIGIDNW